jgi:hypothetical protein
MTRQERERRERLRATFDQAAELYDRARPRYPPALFEDTHHVAGGDQSFFAEVQDCYVRWDPETPPDGTPLRPADDIPSSSDELDRSGRFGPARFRRHEWELPYPTAGYLEVLLTYSGHRALDPTARAGLLDCIARLIDHGYGGRITKRYLTELRVAFTVGP